MDRDPFCECKHRHSRHGESLDINYSAGRCGAEWCRCKHFMVADVQPDE